MRLQPNGSPIHQSGDPVLHGVFHQRLQQQRRHHALAAIGIGVDLHAQPRAEANLLHLQICLGQRQLIGQGNALFLAQFQGGA